MARFIASPILTVVFFGAGGKEFCVANVVIEPDPDIQEIAGLVKSLRSWEKWTLKPQDSKHDTFKFHYQPLLTIINHY